MIIVVCTKIQLLSINTGTAQNSLPRDAHEQLAQGPG